MSQPDQQPALPARADVVVIGSGHNALVAATLLARAGLGVVVVEQKGVLGGATRTEYPFRKVPGLGASTGSYLLGVMPPELEKKLDLRLPLRRRDPHYFLPTTDHRWLMMGSDRVAMKRQMLEFFSAADWEANEAMTAEVAMLADDLAPAWLASPRSLEETADEFIRPALQQTFLALIRRPIIDYLERFAFESDLLKAMYATTDAFSGLHGGLDTPGTGHNFLVHNMCRLPGSDGTWMIVEGGMGTVSGRIAERARQAGAAIFVDSEVESIDIERGAVSGVILRDGRRISTAIVVSGADPFRTRHLVGDTHLPEAHKQHLDRIYRHGTTLKVNLAFDSLPVFSCLPEDRGQFGPTIHLLPQGPDVLGDLRRAYAQVCAGELADEVTIEWYFHTPIDPSLQDPRGHHNGALFVQWVPHTLSNGRSWEQHESAYVERLLSICDRFAPGTSSRVVEAIPLTPRKIESHFGITGGHIHHVDNSFSFDQRAPYRWPVEGLWGCSAGCHPAGSVIGAAGHNAANELLIELGRAAQ